MSRSTLDKNIFRVEEISVDILREDFFVAVEDDFGLVVRRRTEADDDAMNVSFLVGFAVPKP